MQCDYKPNREMSARLSGWARGSYICRCRLGYYSLHHPEGFNGSLVESNHSFSSLRFHNFFVQILPLDRMCLVPHRTRRSFIHSAIHGSRYSFTAIQCSVFFKNSNTVLFTFNETIRSLTQYILHSVFCFVLKLDSNLEFKFKRNQLVLF